MLEQGAPGTARPLESQCGPDSEQMAECRAQNSEGNFALIFDDIFQDLV